MTTIAKEKITRSNWWISAVLLVLASLISNIPMMLVIVPLAVFGPSLTSIHDIYSSLLLQWIGGLTEAFGLWLGIKYASKYVLRNYHLKDASLVARLASIYIVAFMIINFSSGIYILWPNVTVLLVLTYVIEDLLACLAVYYCCKRYLIGNNFSS